MNRKYSSPIFTHSTPNLNQFFIFVEYVVEMLYPDNPYYNQLAKYDGANFTAHSLVTLTWSYTPIGSFKAGTIKSDTQGADAPSGNGGFAVFITQA